MKLLKKLSEQAKRRANKPKRHQIYDLLKASDLEPWLKNVAPDKRKLRKEYRKRKKVAGPEFVMFYRAVL